MYSENIRSKRKDEHVTHVLNQNVNPPNDFERVHLIHQSLPNYDLPEIDLSSRFGNINWQTPIYINAMTGGSAWTKSINEKLSRVAKETGLPMALGSMHAAVKNPSLIHTYTIAREVNPDGFLMANVGADVTLKGAQQAIDMIDAQALQIHINVLQELIMPEGDRSFKAWLSNIENIVNHVRIPVMVKEVGFGMSKETIQQLVDLGVQYVDISGTGGTNFATIENLRRDKQEMDYMSSWGQSTVISLIESQPFQKEISILASGGINTPLDAVKCLSLGAEAVGISKALLERVMNDGVDETIDFVHDFINQMKKIALLVNSKDIHSLQSSKKYLDASLAHWKTQRSNDM